MKSSSAVLSASLLLGSLVGCGQGPASPSVPSALADLAGTWANEDAATQGITHLTVHLDNGAVILEEWGACHPTDCDWGTAAADTQNWRSHRELDLTWNPGFAIETQSLTEVSTARLRLVTSTHFTDNSGRADYDETDYYRR
jgi:hypothetical protein